MVSSKSISRRWSFSTQRILRLDSRSCDNVERSTLLIPFNFENDLSPEAFVPINIRTILKLFPCPEKQPGFLYAWLFGTIVGGWNFLFPHKTVWRTSQKSYVHQQDVDQHPLDIHFLVSWHHGERIPYLLPDQLKTKDARQQVCTQWLFSPNLSEEHQIQE